MRGNEDQRPRVPSRPNTRRGPRAGAPGIAPCLVLSALAHAETSWSGDVGPGVVVLPKYPGSRAENVWPIPAVDLRYGDSLFFDSRRGLGVFLCNDAGLQFGASVWFRRGRHHDDGATVANLKDIGTAGKAQLFASVTRGPIVFDATLAQDIGGSKGLTLDSSASWRFAFSTRAHASFGVTASFASAKFMQTWFGVTTEQSSSSGLPEYSPSAGMKSAG